MSDQIATHLHVCGPRGIEPRTRGLKSDTKQADLAPEQMANDHHRTELEETLTVLQRIRWSVGEPSADLVARAIVLLRDRVGPMTPDELGFKLLRCERITISTNPERKAWFDDLVGLLTRELSAIRD